MQYFSSGHKNCPCQFFLNVTVARRSRLCARVTRPALRVRANFTPGHALSLDAAAAVSVERCGGGRCHRPDWELQKRVRSASHPNLEQRGGEPARRAALAALSLKLSSGVLSPGSVLLVNACLENHIRSSACRLGNLIAPILCLLKPVCPGRLQAIVSGLLLAYARTVYHLGLGSAC